jgi:molybdenum cofactor cytidylyltransferase
MIILGDQPGIKPEVIDLLASEWRQGSAQIALCSYRGHKGHPMIFAKPLFNQLMRLHGDKAAWKLVDANPALVHQAEFDLPFPEDINTWDDFERLVTAGESGEAN